jgi:nucleoside-diphosphate-sugar epimerase
MRVLVTGGIGNVGAAVIERLARGGHAVRVIGRRGGLAVEGAEYVQCDITDVECLAKLLADRDAVVHLAALGNPSKGTPDVVFRVNCMGTFNVYEAAARAGIRRVVTASSINALGFGFGVRDFSISYLPIDEEHPTMPTDAYSFSKNVVEDIADFYWRRDGISGTCLRLPAVLPAPWRDEAAVREYIANCRREVQEMLSLTAAQRRARYEGWVRALEESRKARMFESPPKGWQGVFPGSAILGARSDLWTAVDDRDSAQAVELSLTLPFEGSHVLFINDDHNRTGVDSRTLIELYYPGFAAWKAPVEGTGSLVSMEEARRLLGFRPEYSASRYF